MVVAPSSSPPPEVRLLGEYESVLTDQAYDVLRAAGLDTLATYQPPQTSRAFQKQLERAGLKRTHLYRERICVATVGSRIIGAARFYPNPSWVLQCVQRDDLAEAQVAINRANLTHLGVIPQHQAQGVGGLLLEAATEQARTDGFELIYGLAEGASYLDRFYASHGFTIDGTAENPPCAIFGPHASWARTLHRTGSYFWLRC